MMTTLAPRRWIVTRAVVTSRRRIVAGVTVNPHWRARQAEAGLLAIAFTGLMAMTAATAAVTAAWARTRIRATAAATITVPPAAPAINRVIGVAIPKRVAYRITPAVRRREAGTERQEGVTAATARINPGVRHEAGRGVVGDDALRQPLVHGNQAACALLAPEIETVGAILIE